MTDIQQSIFEQIYIDQSINSIFQINLTIIDIIQLLFFFLPFFFSQVDRIISKNRQIDK